MNQRIMRLPKWCVVGISILIVAFFLLMLYAGSWVLQVLPVVWTGYSMDMLGELLAALVGTLLLIWFGYGGILRQRGAGFVRGFYIGGFVVGQIGMAMIGMLYLQMMEDPVKVQSWWNIVIFAVTMFLVGYAEEVFLRGIVLNLLIQRFSKTGRGVLGAVLISSIIFGLAHFSNLAAGANLESVCVQVIEAVVLGIIFAAIYLRSNNIWVTIILHGLMDFASLQGSGIFDQGDLVDGISMLSRYNLIAVPFLLIPCFVLLRKRKLDEIVARVQGWKPIPGEGEAESTAAISLALGIIGCLTGFLGIGIGIAIDGLLGGITSLKLRGEKNGLAIAAVGISAVAIMIAVIMTLILCWVYYNMGGELGQMMEI